MMIIVGTMGVFAVTTNLYYLWFTYVNLDNDAREITIIVLCCVLCEITIYARFAILSYKPKIYATFLSDFDLSQEKIKKENYEEAILKELKENNRYKKKIKHIKTHYFKYEGFKAPKLDFGTITPRLGRRKLPKKTTAEHE